MGKYLILPSSFSYLDFDSVVYCLHSFLLFLTKKLHNVNRDRAEQNRTTGSLLWDLVGFLMNFIKTQFIQIFIVGMWEGNESYSIWDISGLTLGGPFCSGSKDFLN